MKEKKDTINTSKTGNCRPKTLEELVQEFSEKCPEEAGRLKKLLEKIESKKTELTEKRATDEEIDFAVFDLLVNQIKIDPNLKKDLQKDLPTAVTYAYQGILRGALFIYAQVYYKIIEVVSSAPVSYADLSLNQYYLLVVKKIKYLLSLDEFKGFTGEFNPPEHILPSYGLGDIGWEDGVAPHTESFLASVQTFLNELDFSGDEPEEVAFVQKWLRKQIEPIIEETEEYRQKTEKYFNGLMRNLKHKNPSTKISEEVKPTIKNVISQLWELQNSLYDYSNNELNEYYEKWSKDADEKHTDSALIGFTEILSSACTVRKNLKAVQHPLVQESNVTVIIEQLCRTLEKTQKEVIETQEKLKGLSEAELSENEHDSPMECLCEGYQRAYDKCQDEDLGAHILCLENNFMKEQVESKPAGTKQDNKTVEEDEMITVTEARKLLGVDKGTVSRWATDGVIKDNGETKRKRRVSKVSVLLLKDKREHEDRLKDAVDVLQDVERKIPDRH